MRKFFLIATMLGVLVACKKETSVEADVLAEDSATANVSAENVILKESNIVEISELVNKKNDTLYVTNFFATWCGPCIRELPHFTKKMKELEGQPVKWSYINLDQKSDWETKVKPFTAEYGINNHTILLDLETLTPDFFRNNFKQWDGASIPYTMMRKGDKVDETVGMMTEDELNRKISSFGVNASSSESSETTQDSSVKDAVEVKETV